MRDIPIIFSAPMVLALLGGRKTQTRRLAWRDEIKGALVNIGCKPSPWQRVKPGDRLWVKENFYAFGRWQGTKKSGKVRHTFERRIHSGDFMYAADSPPLVYGRGKFGESTAAWHLRPSIYMERQHSRLTLVVAATKIERLQSISREDALAEGIHETWPGCGWCGYEGGFALTPERAFGNLWCRINGEESWDANPEVVAVTFAVHQKNIDAMPKAP